ncbi:uncharacterized protein LOC120642226 [Panicum virgatum]|uniref:Uncharacterized protein n=1 Tax=Panicum virgatum TaxID=38727 RepID=A0A8T0QS82_PANVG|nr:uncharacterized protein LOC120642226 [Panicum virgatum]KAG2575977.1 hypothetical protein PVAP13_7KG359800 [Panicum virgatum]
MAVRTKASQTRTFYLHKRSIGSQKDDGLPRSQASKEARPALLCSLILAPSPAAAAECMGTRESKCYPSPPDSTSKSAAPAPAKEASPPTTTISSLSLGSTSNSSSSSSAACSSSPPRPRDLILLHDSSKSRECDVVVLDPRSSYHCRLQQAHLCASSWQWQACNTQTQAQAPATQTAASAAAQEAEAGNGAGGGR